MLKQRARVLAAHGTFPRLAQLPVAPDLVDDVVAAGDLAHFLEGNLGAPPQLIGARPVAFVQRLGGQLRKHVGLQQPRLVQRRILREGGVGLGQRLIVVAIEEGHQRLDIGRRSVGGALGLTQIGERGIMERAVELEVVCLSPSVVEVPLVHHLAAILRPQRQAQRIGELRRALARRPRRLQVGARRLLVAQRHVSHAQRVLPGAHAFGPELLHLRFHFFHLRAHAIALQLGVVKR